jgi:hypothetical protein
MVRDRRRRIEKMFKSCFDQNAESCYLQWLWNNLDQSEDFCFSNKLIEIIYVQITFAFQICKTIFSFYTYLNSATKINQ